MMPATIGPRRPARSPSGPQISWPDPNPKKKLDSDNCTKAGDAARSRPISGKAGRYMSIASGANRQWREGHQGTQDDSEPMRMNGGIDGADPPVGKRCHGIIKSGLPLSGPSHRWRPVYRSGGVNDSRRRYRLRRLVAGLQAAAGAQLSAYTM